LSLIYGWVRIINKVFEPKNKLWRNMKRCCLKVLCCMIVAILCLTTQGADKYQGKYKRDYFVQLPDNFDPAKKYWIFVLVHGAGGKGDGIIHAARGYNFSDQCITVAPSFPLKPYYQVLEGNADKQLIDIFKKLQKKYKVHDRMLLWGFSGGAQFAHRFTMKHHKYVLACSSHSGGSWATGGFYHKISSGARYIPFAISCGEQDTGKSVGSASMGRLDWYRAFREEMIKKKMFLVDNVRAGESHGAGPWCKSITEELFDLATTGLYPSQREAFEQEVAKLGEITDPKELKMQLAKVRMFKPKKLSYKKQSVQDTEPEVSKKKKKTSNSYGFTTNCNAELFLKKQFAYYVKEVIMPQYTK
jgi:hypothetical protein